MKRLFFFLFVLFFIKASAQVPYYDFKKFRENNFPEVFLKKHSENNQPLRKVMGRITWSDPNGTFILPRGKTMSENLELMQKLRNNHMGILVYTEPNGTKLYALPQDNTPCLVPDISQFNMPVLGKETKITGMPPSLLTPNEIIPKK